MAPRDLDDDFVLTISDNEDNIPDLDGEPEPELPSTNAKKRKRDSAAADADLSASKKKNKKSKKQKKAPSPSPEPEEDDAEENWAAAGEDDGAMASDFEFQAGDVDIGVVDDFDGWGLESDAKKKGGDKKAVDIDEIIARRRQKHEETEKKQKKKAEPEDSDDDSDAQLDAGEEFTGLDEDETLAEDGFGMGAQDAEESGDEEAEDEDESEDDEEEAEEEDEDEDEEVAKPVAHPDDLQSDSSDDDEEEDPVEVERRKAFFAPEEDLDGSKPSAAKGKGSFQHMSLSRPILKGLAAVGFTEPTPIQSKTIPVALLGKDVVGGAVTGSGKTGAFIIPILERLLYRPKKVPTTRVAILMPTRELAVQCFNVAKKLAAFTDITFAQIVGGFSLREQENILKQRPDVVIATPGRFIDHMRNSASFAVDTLEILVLDEADRMLEDGFADELNEILTTIPKSRQTMLFSATMTDSVDKLIRVGLNKPVRLMVDAKKATVSGLVQEFVRLRPGREEKKLAVLMYLCKEVYTDRVIIFFRQKKEAHRVRILFGLHNIKAAELHGSMSQEQVSRMPNQPSSNYPANNESSVSPPSSPSVATQPRTSSPPTSPPAVSTSRASAPSSTTVPHSPTKSTSTVSVVRPVAARPVALAPSHPSRTARSSKPSSEPPARRRRRTRRRRRRSCRGRCRPTPSTRGTRSCATPTPTSTPSSRKKRKSAPSPRPTWRSARARTSSATRMRSSLAPSALGSSPSSRS